MQIISDLHIHSKYSRAVSPQMSLEGIVFWADKKGINLVGTGDWTHPLWMNEIKNKLIETSKGMYSLKNSSYKARLILSTEISSIYSQGGKVRRVHNVILLPSIETADKVIKELKNRGANLMADGRPIVGISSLDLLKIMLEIDEKIMFIPAHIWTPWFSVFGSKSGFDSLEECFGQLADNIYAVETGLSSDPIMNWQIKELESRSIISSSDAHSGPKLGREATVFGPKISSRFNRDQISNLTYDDITDAIKQKPEGKLKIDYTIEFFPEEGKYHYTGHRACNIRYSALETKEKGIICPVCGKLLTVGVENRVLDLSEKSLTKDDLLFVKNQVGLTFVYDREKRRRPFVSSVPLLEILTEVYDGSLTQAQKEFERLTSKFAPEFEIILKKSYEEISSSGGDKLSQAVKIVRERKVFVDPGYDGVFGKVKVFNDKNAQQTLF